MRETTYRSTYHEKGLAVAREAPARMLPIILQIVDVGSIVDVGCGFGAWLAVAKDLSVPVLHGVEGPWAADWGDVFDPAFTVVLQDLEQPLRLDNRYDLAICLEVAEHLDPSRGGGLVADLCRLGRAVLFGAAVPGQGGDLHVNERPLSEWVEDFAANGYRLLDVRRRFWDDPAIKYYYRQNPALFVPEAAWEEAAERAASLPPLPDTAGIDIVHPDLLRRRTEAVTHLRAALDGPRVVGARERVRLSLGIPAATVRALRRRIRLPGAST